MEQEKKTKREKMSKRRRIGILAALCITFLMGGVSLIQMNRVSESIKEKTAFVIPAAPEADAVSGEKVQEIVPEPDVEEKEEESITAGAKPITLIMDKVMEGEIVLPFSLETLVHSKTLNDWRVHNGIDVAAKSGDAVKAVADGKVSDAYFDPQMGYTIIIDHGSGLESVYQNLASCDMVSRGDGVSRGQVIAAVGNSAAAEMLDESHLHFAVKAGGDFVNPLDFME